MKPTIVSLVLTPVHDCDTGTKAIEIMALMSDGTIVNKTAEANGRILRLDADYFVPPIKADEEDDAA